jgi:plastocyanin
MSAVRRGRVAVGGIALGFAFAGILTVVAPAHARVPSVHKVVTVSIRDNTFSPANLSIEDGTTVRWVNDGRNVHNVTPGRRSTSYGSGNLKPGKSYVQTFPEAGSFAYYCTLHGTPTSGQHGRVSIGGAAAAIPLTPVGAGDHDPPTLRASGRTVRVPEDQKSIPAGVDRAQKGDLVLVSPGSTGRV